MYATKPYIIARQAVNVIPRQELRVNFGETFNSYGSGNKIAIASQKNGANKNINFDNGFKAMGNGNDI